MLRFINSRMSIPARLWLMVLVSTVPDILLTSLFVQQSSLDIGFARKEIDGTKYLSDIWPNFVAMAERGSATGVPQTTPEFDAEFNADAAAAGYREAHGLTDRLEAGKALIGAIADGSNLTLDPDLDSFYAMDAATVRLPGMVNAAIALGKAAAATGDSTSRLVQIAFAVNRLEISAGDAESSLKAAMKNNEPGLTRAALAQLTAKLTKSAQALSADGRALLRGETVDGLAAAESELLRTANATWSATATELQRLLEVRVNGFLHKLYMSLIIAAGPLCIDYWLSRTIARGLTRRVSKLVDVMDRLSSDETGTEIPFQTDRNETGKIARALAAFKGSIDQRKSLESDKRLAGEQSRVVDTIAVALDRLARGDLTTALEKQFPPEYDKMRRNLNTTAERLRDSILTIATSADTIQRSTSEFASSTDDLARRSEHQASALEGSASALNEITVTIQQSAQEAIDVQDTVARVKLQAEGGEGVVREAMAAMNAIQRSSQEIGAIISMMDKIATQTNLLALNATIEAARAGETGRGFAVVATEVRDLAERSARAAKQVRSLISASSAQIDQGASLVVETGAALEGIVAKVLEANSTMTNIAFRASTQAERLRLVNASINSMDKAVQSNVRMAEDTTAAAQLLRSEAERLGALVGRFKIAETEAAAAGAAQNPALVA